jgi:hypothetical protein
MRSIIVPLNELLGSGAKTRCCTSCVKLRVGSDNKGKEAIAALHLVCQSKGTLRCRHLKGYPPRQPLRGHRPAC